MTNATEPDDATLLALGRMTWCAINLEDRAYQVTEHVLPWPQRGPIGTCIDRATRALNGLPAAQPVADAIEWLDQARSALERRNAVLHGMPIVMLMPDESGVLRMTNKTTMQRFSRDGTNITYTVLDARTMGEISSHMEGLLDRWPRLTVALFVHLERNQKRD